MKDSHSTPNFGRGYKESQDFANASFEARSWMFDLRRSDFSGIRNTTRQSWKS